MSKNEGGGVNLEFQIDGKLTDAQVEEELNLSSKQRQFKIIIDEGGEDELNYWPVGVNGKVYQIMRGVEVTVPEEVINVLKDAQAHKVVQKQLPTGQRITSLAKYSRVPWHNLGEVTQGE